FARRLALKEFGGSPFKRVSARGIFRYGGAYGTAIRRSRGEVAPAEKFPAKIAFHSPLEHALWYNYEHQKRRNNMTEVKLVPMKIQSKRWVAVIWYRTDAGLIDVEHEMEELGELQEIVEHGPNWYALDRIEIRHAWQNGTETIEQMTIEDHR